MSSYWVQPQTKLYLPPPTPVAKVMSTDDFVIPTAHFYHGGSERLLTVGNPFYPVTEGGKVIVPHVSGNHYRVFRVTFPDPNKFALTDPNIYDPETERLVWTLRGIQVGRGGPLGVSNTGHPLYNKYKDTENPTAYNQSSDDERQNVSVDPKQIQMIVVGCVPCKGEHWDKATPCEAGAKGDCPPIQLVSTDIQDGDMCDIGYGAMNFRDLQEDKSGVPLEISQSICKWPDFFQMENDQYGDAMFFHGRREQMYCRHMWTRQGVTGEKIPDGMVIPGKAPQRQDLLVNYSATPSGSLVTSDAQLFNRPYWLQHAQGKNNGVLWGNNLFVTVVDNTRNCNFTISMLTEEMTNFDPTKVKQYTRHTEAFEISVILELCKVKLEGAVLAHINTMNPDVLEEWNLGFVPPPQNTLETTYRDITSKATMCPTAVPEKDKEDPYSKLNFWLVDLKEKLSTELDQFPLGRKFLHQTGLGQRSQGGTKRSSKSTTRHAAKRKRAN
ncbi:L1 protein [Felis catus papillomavirus 6]|uniref:Major capsid protein L1 n=1 Tax=Felis catus papillomavirus 6 TaxID=2704502 RepID=A0A6B9WFC5_9PAPI|nr:L1 protein [Felis catus papillomavirus 6]